VAFEAKGSSSAVQVVEVELELAAATADSEEGRARTFRREVLEARTRFAIVRGGSTLDATVSGGVAEVDRDEDNGGGGQEEGEKTNAHCLTGEGRRR
jgi:hypothetical protein